MKTTEELQDYINNIPITTDDATILKLVNSLLMIMEKMDSIQCDCSVKERDSGHKTGCWKANW